MSDHVEWVTATSGFAIIGPDDEFSDAHGSTVDDHALAITGGGSTTVVEGSPDELETLLRDGLAKLLATQAAPRTPGATTLYEQLDARPTLSVGQTSDLKYETALSRVWIARTGLADGEPFEHTVYVEQLTGGVWRDVATLNGDTLPLPATAFEDTDGPAWFDRLDWVWLAAERG